MKSGYAIAFGLALWVAVIVAWNNESPTGFFWDYRMPTNWFAWFGTLFIIGGLLVVIKA